MKKLLLIFALTCVILSGCSSNSQQTDNSKSSVQSTSSSQSSETSEEETQKEDLSKELENIKVTASLDEMMGYEKVTIENTSSYVFTSSVHVRFYNSNNKMVGNDTIFVESLAPGDYTWANISVSELGELSFKYDFSMNYEFTEPQSVSNNQTVNDDWSAEMTEKMSGFQNTSWYPFIEEINVYNGDGERDALVIAIVSSNTSQEDIDRIGNTIFGNFAFGTGANRSFDVISVSVQNSNGDELFLRTK